MCIYHNLKHKVDHPPPVEATASPLEAKDIGDDITRNEATEDEEERKLWERTKE